MVLRPSPFPNAFLHGLHSLSWGLIFPCYWFLERFLCSFKETTLEKKQRQSQRCSLYPLRVFLGATVFLFLLVLSMPIAFLGFIIWAPLQAVRRPFSYLHSQSQGDPKEWAALETCKPFIFVSANLCLLPDGLARFSNLSDTQERSALIGQNIMEGVTRKNTKEFMNGVLNQENEHKILYAAIDDSDSVRSARRRDSTSRSSGGDERKDGNVFAGYSNAEDPAVDPLVISIDMGVEHEPVEYEPHNRNSIPEKEVNGPLSSEGQDIDLSDSLNLAAPDGRSRKGGDGCIRCEIAQLIPAGADFVCLQEVFDKRAAKRLSRLLSPVFEHILYDVGVYGPLGCSDFKFFNSGLFLASRYPILEAQYRHFANGSGEDALAAKGLLCVKSIRRWIEQSVSLALCPKDRRRVWTSVIQMQASRCPDPDHCPEHFLSSAIQFATQDNNLGLLCFNNYSVRPQVDGVLVGLIQGKRLVGFMNCTHLHAPEADGHIRCAQLTTLLTWISEFQERNTDTSDLVAFDVLCGDFNFDNCSPDDHLEQKHEIFSSYEDPCRAGPKKDKEWAIGTLLQQWMLYDDAVNSAQSLQRTLEKEESRKKYIAPPINPDGSPDESDTGAPWTGRRIDYILYRNGPQESSLQAEVDEFTFITHLAGLTDHLAVGLRLFVSCPLREGEGLHGPR